MKFQTKRSNFFHWLQRSLFKKNTVFWVFESSKNLGGESFFKKLKKGQKTWKRVNFQDKNFSLHSFQKPSICVKRKKSFLLEYELIKFFVKFSKHSTKIFCRQKKALFLKTFFQTKKIWDVFNDFSHFTEFWKKLRNDFFFEWKNLLMLWRIWKRKKKFQLRIQKILRNFSLFLKNQKFGIYIFERQICVCLFFDKRRHTNTLFFEGV